MLLKQGQHLAKICILMCALHVILFILANKNLWRIAAVELIDLNSDLVAFPLSSRWREIGERLKIEAKMFEKAQLT